MTTENILFAFGLTLFAGLATGIGSALAFYAKASSPRFLAASLGFSAGVMIYVSMIEIFPKANEALSNAYNDSTGYVYATIGFFVGILIIAIIDKLVPSFENPHEIKPIISNEEDIKKKKLYRMGIFSALAIAIHNFPEGLATFIAAIENPTLGISIAIAIAIHNIPEGIAVSVPVYYATQSKKKAFFLSFASGLSEPIGALIGFTILYQFISEALLGFTFAIVAGIMVYISLDELLPTAEKYGEHHVAIYGLISGMALMAVSLILFM